SWKPADSNPDYTLDHEEPVCACLGAAGSHQVEHFAAELLGVTLRHGHGSFDGRRDQKSSKPTPL
ncbi:hypothetical protein, partial [Mycobacterium canetti]|uniref:hypothetical protein n=1 Tax=Mycobacterium canetti TaxID=78331 RepID=UPI001E30810D